MAHYLLVIGDREALGWVLTAQRMAFPGFGRAEIRALSPGDELLLYTTRGCFKNPTRDRGRVIAVGTARTAVATLDAPVEIAGRSFPVGCDVEFHTATRWPGGVELSPLVGELDAFADLGRSWSVRLRRPLARLTDGDAKLLRTQLEAAGPEPLERVLDQYTRWWQPGRSRT
ncbi:hypothetical protein [Prauserella muralis]|uniref:Uncharacterized protein n=1 Tax=Prauserella muralis TaxID=588067 RepID=A0A2V4B1G1_9PSEU|nr:hypothetical protein [Prauserella muralis]PXY27883.1 hypothetical protein BAY60_16100 [Prauserella muralis]TWE22344.1 hypothetical protein FHX69_3582 [Prauserella muralis]